MNDMKITVQHTAVLS